MKNIIYIRYILFACTLLLTNISCKEEDDTSGAVPDDGTPKISFINPISGKVGDSVSIYGKNLSSIQEPHVLKLGEFNMEVVHISEGKIVAKVPPHAVSSKISIAIKDKIVQTELFEVVYNYPLITSIEPATAKPGDIVTIKGEDFSEGTVANRVVFGAMDGAIKSISKTELKVVVPDVAYKVEVKVTSNNKISNMVYYSVLPVPSISSIKPTVACPGMNVDINGSRYDEGFNLKVGFNDQILPIKSMSSGPSGPYKLQVVVPENAVTGTMSVTATTGTATSPQLKIISKPTITIPAVMSGSKGSEVTIEGTDLTAFGEDGVQVSFGYQLAEIISLTNTSVKVKIPESASGETELKVYIYGYLMSAGTFTVNE